MTRRSVLQIFQPLEGGVPAHVVHLANGLPEHGWQVEVAAPIGTPFLAPLERTGVRVHSLPMTRAPGPADLRAALALRKLDGERAYTVVHAHSSKAGVLARAALPDRRRLVYSPHCFSFIGGFDPIVRTVYRLVEQALVPRTASLVAASNWERDEARRRLHGAAGRLRVVRPGVPACRSDEVSEELLAFKQDHPLAGTICRLEPQKDPVALVRAAAILRARGATHLRLAIVGNGALRDAVDAEISRLGLFEMVRLFPFRGGVEPYIRALDLFVLPSLWESLPIAVLEAMACRVPVLASDVGGTSEAVEDGVTGRLVAPADAGALAAALQELLEHPAALGQLAEAGFETTQNEFSHDRMVRQTAALYDALRHLTRAGLAPATLRSMGRTPRFLLVLPLAVLLLVGFSAPAEAAKRKVPFGFFGAVLHPMEPPAADQQVELMARSGVETGRVILLWTGLEPAPGVYEWGQLDLLAAAAARHGIALQPNVTQTPLWASNRQSDPDYWRWPPADPQTFADLMRQMVLRYGPNGSFWAQNPSLPKVPIRQWQIWNEQTAPWNWKARPWGPSYVKLLKGAYKAIHGLDRHATVVAGSLVAPSATYAPWNAVSDLYRYGGKRYFDMIAVHPFTNGPSVKVATTQMLEILSRVRARMNKHHDRKKRIIVTELTWPAAVGRVPKSALEQAAGLSTTRRGQAARLKSAYRALASKKRKLGVSQVYWYAWATEYDNDSPDSVMAFRYSGLNRFSGGVFSREPVLRTYTNLAAKYEGCRKSSNARRCR